MRDSWIHCSQNAVPPPTQQQYENDKKQPPACCMEILERLLLREQQVSARPEILLHFAHGRGRETNPGGYTDM